MGVDTLSLTLLDPTDWEKLIAEKEWKISAKFETEAARGLQPPNPSLSAFRDTTLARNINGLGDFGSRIFQSATDYVGRRVAEYNADAELNRILRKYSHCWSLESRYHLLKLHR